MYKHFLKRLIDFFLSLFAIIILSPLFIILLIILKITNKKAGVFFIQERPGFKGKTFHIIKFKSMTDKKDTEGNLLPNEQRVTKIGKIIRSTSLDELPQLFNVLKGDMAIIGPRPLMTRYLKLYSKEQMRRHDVRPGISGWAQCHGRNNITWTEKFTLDVWYVDHLSAWLDLKIIFITVYKVIKHSDINSGVTKIGTEGFNGSN